jgi:protein TonB
MPLTAASCRRIAITATVALHAVALIQVLALGAQATPRIRPAEPIAVQWIAPPRVESPKPKPAPPPPPPKPRTRPEPKPPTPNAVQRQPAPLIAAADAPPAADAYAAEPTPPVPAAVPGPPVAAAAPPTPGPPVPPLPITPPRFDAAYLDNPPPPYPSQARRLGERGRVVLRVLVTAVGLPERVELRTSSGSPRLDGAALQAVQRWKFVPARQGETPVSAWVLVPILFTLEG